MTRTGGANPAKVMNSSLEDSGAYGLDRIIFCAVLSKRPAAPLQGLLKYKAFDE